MTCPNCQSENVELIENLKDVFPNAIFATAVQCQDCGLTGEGYPSDDVDSDNRAWESFQSIAMSNREGTIHCGHCGNDRATFVTYRVGLPGMQEMRTSVQCPDCGSRGMAAYHEDGEEAAKETATKIWIRDGFGEEMMVALTKLHPFVNQHCIYCGQDQDGSAHYSDCIWQKARDLLGPERLSRL